MENTNQHNSGKNIRTRFAPSPTGYLHIGGLRTALYCYLYAKKHQGTFILRIEDTDRERFVPGAMENLIQTLKWIGINPDEGPETENSQKGNYGPYIQSQRTEIYRRYAQELITKGEAYYCFCDRERLEEMRKNQEKNKLPTIYDRKCLNLPDSEIKEKLKQGLPFVIRQKMPYAPIKFKDSIRGTVQFDGKLIDDQILIKSDGFPTYHLANVIDDHEMKITNVIRGEEWLPSTPKHLALYQSFGWEAPQFAHLPLLLNADKSKLSKRQGDVAVEEYIRKGYLRESIINFAAFLGWNPGEGEKREIFNLAELTEIFSLEKVHKSGAIFNIEKLNWFNWRWQKEIFYQKLREKALSLDPLHRKETAAKGQEIFFFKKPTTAKKFTAFRQQELMKLCAKYLPPEVLTEEKNELLHLALMTVEEKILKNPQETFSSIEFYFKEKEYPKELLTHEKMQVDFKSAKDSLELALEALYELKEWQSASIQATMENVIVRNKLKNGQLLWPLRSALTGEQFSPGVFDVAFVLGKENTIQRITNALKKLT